MASPGRQPAVPLPILKSIFSKYKFEIQQNLNHSSATIWKIISKELLAMMSPKLLYNYASQNRNNCLDILEIQKEEKFPEIMSSDSSDDGEDNVKVKKDIFEISMTGEEWNQIYPNADNPNRLKMGWTHVLEKIISSQLKIPCLWVFSNNYVSLNSIYLIKIKAFCKQCSAVLLIKKLNTLNNIYIKFICEIYNYKTELHNNIYKRPLSGIKREEVANELQKDLAINWRLKKANETMEYGELEPRTLYSLDVLRKCKQSISNKYNIKSDSVINQLLYLKYTQPYLPSIINISCDKFFMHYWLPEQMITFNKYCQDTNVSILQIDATGTLVKKIKSTL
ncbi:uncharacterized protein LOC135931347 [Gordionus sp. m RMFG-2023]|uniref:uncharacterized protein LOC135931347 n=1 Tax=Gordionus sp. m RMFG-2023 TaxID=3053472 RepID=UPI0031FE0064